MTMHIHNRPSRDVHAVRGLILALLACAAFAAVASSTSKACPRAAAVAFAAGLG